MTRRRAYPQRSIPACAGEARGRGRCRPAVRVYPRVCGGSRWSLTCWCYRGGLSPRVRGKPPAVASASAVSRSIPACAGEAPRCRAWRPPPWVYPRVCGGSGPSCRLTGGRMGLSPRVRGKRGWRCRWGWRWRSIPACAGEAPEYGGVKAQFRVYPRVCGGSRIRAGRMPCSGGLSPRVRGKPKLDKSRNPASGSIPACAGEAPLDQQDTSWGWVYPRVCGGSGAPPRRCRPNCGLSPRVRGKLTHPPHRRRRLRSIPACAGEARIAAINPARRPVYPRVCGGSAGQNGGWSDGRGLSPRVRGKPRQ